jgi:trehalose/maltose hydrolase-like predicted phosphorylase
MLECARFLHQYSYYKPQKQRYELLDVVCPDEYHERVNNDAYTNTITKTMLEKMFQLLDRLRTVDVVAIDKVLEKTGMTTELEELRHFTEKLYVPTPRKDGVIEQFDRFFLLEDIPIKTMLERKLHEGEYLGGANGLAAYTQNLKQADVVLVNMLMPERYTDMERLSNYRYYEPRTEHGSTLSACIYGLAAADSGDIEKAYHYFMKTAQVDLTGQYSLYIGGIFIGGTHAAANGGAWMTAVMGFAGLRASTTGICITPRLPEHWALMVIPMRWHDAEFRIEIQNGKVTINAGKSNKEPVVFTVFGETKNVCTGETQCFMKHNNRKMS